MKLRNKMLLKKNQLLRLRLRNLLPSKRKKRRYHKLQLRLRLRNLLQLKRKRKKHLNKLKLKLMKRRKRRHLLLR
jgi:hypothetical protein